MRRGYVFLSYAAERQALAERISLALRAEGFGVFFDRSDLPAGTGFDARIRAALERSDFLVFLLSPESIDQGSYALSELSFARERWPIPTGRVLPVLLEPLLLETLPSYLRAVTILKPEGDMVAETAAAAVRLDFLQRAARRKQWTRWAALIVLLAALLSLAFWQIQSKWRRTDISTGDPERYGRGFGDQGDTFVLRGKARNDRSSETLLKNLELIVDDRQIGIRVLSRNPDSYPLPLAAKQSAAWIFTFSFFDRGHSSQGLREIKLPAFHWQVCWTDDQGRNCTRQQLWKARGSFTPVIASEISDSLRQTAVIARAVPQGYVVATRKPNTLLLITERGDQRASASLEGQPVDFAIVAGAPHLSSGLKPGDLVVATRSPDAVTVFSLDGERLISRWQRAIDFDRQDRYGQHVSTEPSSLAVNSLGIWLRTEAEAGVPGLVFLQDPQSAWWVPRYYNDIAFDLTGMAVRGIGDEVWGVSTGTIPSSIYLLERERYIDFSGHEYDVVSCATDLGAGPKGPRLQSCEEDSKPAEILDLMRKESTLLISDRWGDVSVKGDPELRRKQVFSAGNPNMAAVALNLLRIESTYVPVRTQVFAFSRPGSRRTLLDLPGLETVSLAASKGTVFVILHDEHGNSDAVLLQN